MVNPFYAAEQKTLYPHRTITTSKEQAVEHLKSLLSKGLITEHYLNSTTIGRIKHEILLNISSLDCSEVIRSALTESPV